MSRRVMLLAVTIAAAPALAWMVFSLFFITGLPLPSSYYAKLQTGIRPIEYVSAGSPVYLIDSFSTDPLTLLTIGMSVALAFGTSSSRQRVFAAGIVLYVAYVVRIGGDFMSGEDAIPPLCAAALLAVNLSISLPQRTAWMAVAIVVGLWANGNHLFGVERREGVGSPAESPMNA